jgi:hypothetical protein
MSNEWLEIMREAVKLPALLSDIYGDLLKPGVRQVGKALETIIGLGNTVLWPVALVNERARITLERNLEKYRNQLQAIPEADIISVTSEVGVPIAERMAYVADDALSDLYVNLLAKASTLQTSRFAHPAFIHIIDSLSPDEAGYLREIQRRGRVPFLTVEVVNKKRGEFLLIADLLTGIEKLLPLSFPNNTEAYLSNFEGLGLIRIRRDLVIAGSEEMIYDALQTLYEPTYKDELAKPRPGTAWDPDPKRVKLKFGRGSIYLTPFGEMFLEACMVGMGS